RAGVPAENIRAWVANDSRPTIGQLRKLAGVLHRPVALFYLPSPPGDVGVPPALRRTAGAIRRDLTPPQLRQARRARRMQRLAQSLLASEGWEGPHLPQLTTKRDHLRYFTNLHIWPLARRAVVPNGLATRPVIPTSNGGRK